MKVIARKLALTVVALPLIVFLVCLAANRAEADGERIANRQGTARMVAGETGFAGSGSPPGPFGDHWVHLQNNGNVDSYDSREGPYSESQGCEALVGSNVNPNDSAGGVSIDNNGEICGDVAVTTPVAEGDITQQNNAVINGDLRYSQPSWELKPLEMPAWYTAAGGGPEGTITGDYGSKPGKYEITGNGFRAYNNAEVTFSAGRYHFDTFELSNNVEFQVDPDIGEDETIDIYVGGSIIFENNSELLPPIAITGDTTKLRFYFNGTSKVDLSNNVEFYGFIYAPNALIEVYNNDKIYGNLVGKQVYIWNNAGVHYDKALLDQDFGHIFTGGVPALPHERVDWKEIIN